MFLLGLLSCSVSSLADWQTKAISDPLGELSQFSLRPSDDFPLFTFSCISVEESRIDMLQIDHLTRDGIDDIERIEIRVDANPSMIFFPDQHIINFTYQYYPQIEFGIETVTMIPSNGSGEVQFAELLRQFIGGRRGAARVVSSTEEKAVAFSLMGFTQAYLSMRTACLDAQST